MRIKKADLEKKSDVLHQSRLDLHEDTVGIGFLRVQAQDEEAEAAQ